MNADNGYTGGKVMDTRKVMDILGTVTLYLVRRIYMGIRTY